jgi:hypothetical protein
MHYTNSSNSLSLSTVFRELMAKVYYISLIFVSLIQLHHEINQAPESKGHIVQLEIITPKLPPIKPAPPVIANVRRSALCTIKTDNKQELF